jgi:hypothetical protein
MIEIHFVVRSARDDVGATLLATTITGYKYSYLSTHPLPFLELIVFNLYIRDTPSHLGALPRSLKKETNKVTTILLLCGVRCL